MQVSPTHPPCHDFLNEESPLLAHRLPPVALVVAMLIFMISLLLLQGKFDRLQFPISLLIQFLQLHSEGQGQESYSRVPVGCRCWSCVETVNTVHCGQHG